jgi:hypothetical protein
MGEFDVMSLDFNEQLGNLLGITQASGYCQSVDQQVRSLGSIPQTTFLNVSLYAKGYLFFLCLCLGVLLHHQNI